MLHLQPSGKLPTVFVLTSQLLAAVTVPPQRLRLLSETEERQQRRANIPPSTCLLSNWGILEHGRPSVFWDGEDECSGHPLFWFGSDKHRLSPAAWSPDHSSLNTGEGKERGGGWVESKRKRTCQQSSYCN